jgi:hypothetical protein
LVLGMTSAVSALTLEIKNDDVTFTPTAWVEGDLDQDLYLAILGNGPLTYTLGDEAPSLSEWFGTEADMITYGYGHLVPAGYTGDVYILGLGMPPEEYVPGTYLKVSGTAGDMAYACWFDPMTTTEGVIGEVELLPEPMTIALLGLGGLFLLRRRK